jgi:tRNA(Arg) A34 adenosine deaminase TadA
MSATYWSRIDAVYFSNEPAATAAIGIDDAFQYEDFQKPLHQRCIHMQQLHPEIGVKEYETWSNHPTRHPY